jgi:hypothetical protein
MKQENTGGAPIVIELPKANERRLLVPIQNAPFIEYSNQGLNKINNSTPGAIWRRFKQFTPYQIYDALILLRENGDIQFDESAVDYLNTKIVCTPKDIISCKSGYYKTENKKDYTQNLELHTKWVFIFIL